MRNSVQMLIPLVYLKLWELQFDESVRRKIPESGSVKSRHVGISELNGMFEREDEQTFKYEM